MLTRFSIARPGTKALTLVEVLVVIVIIGILIALLLPVLSSAKAKAARTACISNQKQLSAALLLYTEHGGQGRFPSTNLSAYAPTSMDWESNDIRLTYRFFIAPELGGQTRVFQCPADTFSSVPRDGDDYIVLNRSWHESLGTSYGFNGHNFPTNVPPPYGGLAGVLLERVPHPERTVLTYDGPTAVGYTWHGPRQRPYCDITKPTPVRNVMSFVDGHAEFLSTVMPFLVSTNTGVISEPPAGFDYQWNVN
jgi:prepilin-type N-terminal cleavage/methylation domain-containing protein